MEPGLERFAEVAVSLPIQKTFTYRVPSVFEDQMAVGKRVLVSFRRRKVTGYIIAFPVLIPSHLDPTTVKEIIDLLDETPLFDEKMLSSG